MLNISEILHTDMDDLKVQISGLRSVTTFKNLCSTDLL